MTLLKKVNPEWSPKENENLKVGETIDMTDYRTLVENGTAVLVDESGNEIPLPGTLLKCPVCFQKFNDIASIASHMAEHTKTVVSDEKVAAPEGEAAQTAEQTIAELAAKAISDPVEEVTPKAKEAVSGNKGITK